MSDAGTIYREELRIPMQTSTGNDLAKRAVRHGIRPRFVPVDVDGVALSWNRRHEWLKKSPLLLVSIGLHALILSVLFFVLPSNSSGRGTFGFSNGDGASAFWIRGDGGDGANGIGNGKVGDTVLTDDGSAESHEANQILEAQPVEKEVPLLDVVQTDPQSVFDADTPESENPLKNALSKVDSQRQATARLTSSTNPVTQEMDDAREASADQVRDSGKSNGLATAKSNRVGAGLNHDGAAGGEGNGAGLGDGPSDGTRNRIAFFGLSAKAKRVVYVIDASESMRNHNAMELARQELWASLQGLTLTTQFQIVFFNLTNYTLSLPNERLRLLPATSQNMRLAKQFLTGIQPDSGTDRFAAISQALRLDPEVIYLLTDADAPVLSAKDLSEIQRANKRRAIIHVVEFGVGGDLTRESFLKRLARENHGMHWYHDLTRANR